MRYLKYCNMLPKLLARGVGQSCDVSIGWRLVEPMSHALRCTTQHVWNVSGDTLSIMKWSSRGVNAQDSVDRQDFKPVAFGSLSVTVESNDSPEPNRQVTGSWLEGWPILDNFMRSHLAGEWDNAWSFALVQRGIIKKPLRDIRLKCFESYCTEISKTEDPRLIDGTHLS